MEVGRRRKIEPGMNDWNFCYSRMFKACNYTCHLIRSNVIYHGLEHYQRQINTCRLSQNTRHEPTWFNRTWCGDPEMGTRSDLARISNTTVWSPVPPSHFIQAYSEFFSRKSRALWWKIRVWSVLCTCLQEFLYLSCRVQYVGIVSMWIRWHDCSGSKAWNY